MQVRATTRGFLYWLRHPGEVFECAEHLFSKEWMEKVESTDGAAVPVAGTPTIVPAPAAAPFAGPSANPEPDLDLAANPQAAASPEVKP